MKTSLIRWVRESRIIPPRFNKLLIFGLFMIFITHVSFSQSFSKFYEPEIGYDFDHLESYIIQKFEPSSVYPFEGTIMVQTVTTATNSAIQITLVNTNGLPQLSYAIFEGTGMGDFVPTCAAYNSVKQEYCIAGIQHDVSSTNADMQGWFLFLDNDLNVLSSYICGVDLSASGIGPTTNMFVTDITSIEGISSTGLGDFVYVGVGGNADDPTPTNSAISLQKQMCIGYASSTGMGYGVTYDLTNVGAANEENNMYFPNRVIELPVGTTDGGFMVCGVGAIDPGTNRSTTFFLRTDYQFGTPASATGNNDIELYSDVDNILIGADLYFDHAQQEVWFAGTGYKDDEIYFIYQKLHSLSTPGVHIYGNLGVSTTPAIILPAFGKMTPWYSPLGILDLAKIMPSDDADIAGIASNYYECNYYHPGLSSFTFPMLNRINYSDAFLDDFSNLQTTDIYTYPRIAGNTGLGNLLPYLSYNYRHFPNHNAHQRHLSGYGAENYVLGATTYHPLTPNTPPEYIALNGTTIFEYNACYYRTQSLTGGNISVSLYVPPISGTLSELNIYSPSIAITTLTDIEFNDCLSDIQFKLAATNQQSILQNYGNGFQLKCKASATSFKVYSSMGAMIYMGKINFGYAYADMSNYASGTYLIEVIDAQHQRISVQKFTK